MENKMVSVVVMKDTEGEGQVDRGNILEGNDGGASKRDKRYEIQLQEAEIKRNTKSRCKLVTLAKIETQRKS